MPRRDEESINHNASLQFYPGGGVLKEIFADYVPLASQNPYSIIVNFWSVVLPFIDPILVTFGHYSLCIVYFVANYRPILVTFGHYSLCIVYFVANYRPHLSHFWVNTFLPLKFRKTCDPLLKILENVTPL